MVAVMLKRSLSMSAIAQQLIKAPIQVHGIEGRYASALYSAAFKQKKLDVVSKDFMAIRDTYKTNPRFREFVQDPTLKPANRKSGIQACARKLGVCKEMENFLGEPLC